MLLDWSPPTWDTHPPQMTSSMMSGVDAGAFDEFVEHHRRKVRGVLVGEAAVALSDGCAHGSDDDCFPHYLCSDLGVTAHRPVNSGSRLAANAE